jgi:hypothetical protein
LVEGSRPTRAYSKTGAPIERGVDPKERSSLQKVPLHILPPSLLVYAALAFRDGAGKYGAFNWRKTKIVGTIYYAAALRHMLAWWDGEELAVDSGVPHLAHALACLAIIIDAYEGGFLDDDRPPKGPASRLLRRWKRKRKK